MLSHSRPCRVFPYFRLHAHSRSSEKKVSVTVLRRLLLRGNQRKIQKNKRLLLRIRFHYDGFPDAVDHASLSAKPNLAAVRISSRSPYHIENRRNRKRLCEGPFPVFVAVCELNARSEYQPLLGGSTAPIHPQRPSRASLLLASSGATGRWSLRRKLTPRHVKRDNCGCNH